MMLSLSGGRFPHQVSEHSVTAHTARGGVTASAWAHGLGSLSRLGKINRVRERSSTRSLER